jgi:hypothetical protein
MVTIPANTPSTTTPANAPAATRQQIVFPTTENEYTL